MEGTDKKKVKESLTKFGKDDFIRKSLTKFEGDIQVEPEIPRPIKIKKKEDT